MHKHTDLQCVWIEPRAPAQQEHPSSEQHYHIRYRGCQNASRLILAPDVDVTEGRDLAPLVRRALHGILGGRDSAAGESASCPLRRPRAPQCCRKLGLDRARRSDRQRCNHILKSVWINVNTPCMYTTLPAGLIHTEFIPNANEPALSCCQLHVHH